MKKISRGTGRFFRRVGLFFDKFLITPITKFILRIIEFAKNSMKNLDRVSSKKSTLLIVSLILAFFVFVFIDRSSSIMIDQYAEILYNQPVTAVYNEELYVVDGLPEKVDITLIGQRRHIFLAKQSPSKGVSVDLTGLKPGNHKVSLKYNQRLKSLDYKLDPSQVNITIYEKVSENRSLTYDLLHQDGLDTKLYISEVELDRSDVIVKGAQYKLDTVASVKALLDVNTIPNPAEGDNSVKDIPLVAYDNDGNIVDVEIVPKTVSANVKITSPSKEIPVRIVPTGEMARGKSIKSIETSISKVTVYGEQTAVDAIEKLDVEIDVKGLDKDKEYNITLTKPRGITELSSKTMTIKVMVDDSSYKEFPNISVTTKNLDSKYKVQAKSDKDRQVTVAVKGSSESLENLKESDIIAFVDLKDYGEGTHEVPIQVTGTDLKLSYESKNKKITVVITKK